MSSSNSPSAAESLAPPHPEARDAGLLPAKVRMLYEQAQTSLPFNILMAVFLVFILWGVTPSARLIVWLAFVVTLTALRGLAVRRYLSADPSPRCLPWLRLYGLGAALAGIAWGTCVIALAPLDSVAYTGIVVLWTAGMTAGGIVAFSIVPAVFFAYAVPALLPGAAYLLVVGGPMTVEMGVGMLAYFLFLAVAVRRVSFRQHQNLTLQERNAQLVAEIRTEKAKVDAFNSELEQRVAERTAELQASEQRIRKLAYYDGLTGLHNDIFVRLRLSAVSDGTAQVEVPLALLMFDIERFDDINDALGNEHGDQLLKHVARTLQSTVGDSELAARLGASVFAVLIPDITGDEDALRRGRALLAGLEGLAFVGGAKVAVRLKGGIAIWPRHARDARGLLRCASTAKRACYASWSNCLLFSPEYELHPRSVTLVAELSEAVGTGQFLLHYQPKVDLRAGRVTSAEALLRWQHPTHGFIPPDEFIGLAERTGIITPLTLWVIEQVLAQAHAWREAGMPLGICINISARDLHYPDFATSVQALLDRYEMEVGSVTLELTESSVMQEPEQAIVVLARLREMGLRLSLDDFGTGYSSLAYLKRLYFDEIKIDRGFVMHMLTKQDDASIVRSTISLGHELGLSVTAEGIEDDATLDEIRRLGCDLGQGYGISRPLAADAFAVWLRDEQSRQRPVREANTRTLAQ